MRKLTSVLLCNVASVLWAQTNATPADKPRPVHVMRVPPQPPPEVDPLRQQISADLQALQGSSPNVPSLPSIPAPSVAAVPSTTVL
jgi:hypothetical protein